MRLKTPEYYKNFKCIAGDCKDTCCAGWEVDVDEKAQEYYVKVEGEFGKRLKDNTIIDEEGIRFKLLEKKRCCFLNDCNLCDLYTALGEEHLCDTCTDFPRFTEEFGDVRELGISLSCPTAANLILNHQGKLSFDEEEIDEMITLNDIDYDLYMQLIAAREQAYDILNMQEKAIIWRNIAILLFANDIQKVIFKGNYKKIENVRNKFADVNYINKRVVKICNQAIRHVDGAYNTESMLDIFASFEVVNEKWPEKLANAKKVIFGDFDSNDIPQKVKELEAELNNSAGKGSVRKNFYEQIMVYFVYRYFMKAVYDYDLISKVKLAIISYIVIRAVEKGERLANGKLSKSEFIWLAHMYSREIEHSDDNMDKIEELSGSDMTFHIEALVASLIE